MKKVVVFFCLFLSGWFAGNASASMWMPEVSFLAVDDPLMGDGNVVLSEASIPPSLVVFYSIDQENWASSPIFATALSGSTRVYARLSSGDTGGVVTFLGPDNGGPDLYNSLIIDWSDGDTSQLSFLAANDDDNLSPVPAPTAMLLLSSGLAGLAGVSRLSRKK